ncbi:MAG: carboxyl-terminal processing protease [Saprospiraceae bacterium]|jgi:carboxyl-terminal processing protease
MKIKGAFFLAICLTGMTLLAFYPAYDSAEKESVLMETILNFQSYYHYSPQEIDDDFSVKLYDSYVERLDGGRRWLIESEVNQLELFKKELDNEAQAGQYGFMNLSVKLQEAGIERSQAYYREFLAEPFDFTKNEVIQRDGDKLEWAKDEVALKEYWRKSMKYEVMTRLSDKLKSKAEDKEDFKDKTDAELEAEARKEVLKVYDDWYLRLDKRKRSDHISSYLNAITHIFDPHTGYFEPIDKENFNINMSGKLKGIGARLQIDGDYTKVTEIIVGGPAWKGKELEAEDKITAVAQKGEEPVNIAGMVINDVVKMIRGEPDTEVLLHVKKKDGSSEIISIIRDVVILDEGYAKSLILDTDNGDQVGYIRLPRFYGDYQNRTNPRNCSDDVQKEINKLKAENVKGIILDLRNNGGGYLSEVVKMGGFFVEEGPMVQVKSRDRAPRVLDDENPSVDWDGHLIVMVNSFSASASEILAAALQDYDRALIVGTGESTFGKGTVQRFVNLDDAVRGHTEVKPLGELKITIQNYYRINGGSVQLKGVVPDIILPDNYRYIETGEKEHDHPLPFTEIEAATFSQNVYSLDEKPMLREKSAARILSNPTFQKVEENAKWLKAQRDDTEYSLNLVEYQAEDEALDARNKEYKGLMDKEAVMGIRNPTADVKVLDSADESKIARNDEWIKGVKKDAHLEETLNVMADMIGGGK